VRAWVNCQLLEDPTGPAVAVSDHGLTVGDGVFEAVKAVGARPFALTRHLERLARSAEGLGLPVPDLDVVRRAVGEVLRGTNEPLSRVRITYTGGPAPLGSGRGDAEPTLIVVAAPLDEAAESSRVATVPWPRNERGALAGLKTTSYGENVVMLAHAKERGAGEAVMANLAGHLRGDRVQRLLRRRRRAAHPVARERVPGRGHPGAGPGVVRRARDRRAHRRRTPRERGLPRLHHPRRAARQRLGRPRPAGPRAGHQGRPGSVGRARDLDAGGPRLMG
jgi:hypothetical protein